MNRTAIPAIILAGGSREDKVAAAQGKPVKALCVVGGRPLVCYVVDAVSGAGLRPIVVATSPEAVEEMDKAVGGGAAVVAADGPRFTDTIRAGLAAVPDAERVLLATGDLPALTAEAVRRFVDEALASGAELVYATVRADTLDGAMAAGKRVRVKLREGKFVGGNLVLASPALVRRAVKLIEGAFSARKSAIGLARLLGFSFVLRFALGRLDIPAIVRRAESLLGCTAAVVISPDPEVCFDMDHPEDLALAEEVLAARR